MGREKRCAVYSTNRRRRVVVHFSTREWNLVCSTTTLHPVCGGFWCRINLIRWFYSILTPILMNCCSVVIGGEIAKSRRTKRKKEDLHLNCFRLLLNRFFLFLLAGKPISWAMLNPSVSPFKISANGMVVESSNPAVRLYRYNTYTGEVWPTLKGSGNALSCICHTVIVVVNQLDMKMTAH